MIKKIYILLFVFMLIPIASAGIFVDVTNIEFYNQSTNETTEHTVLKIATDLSSSVDNWIESHNGVLMVMEDGAYTNIIFRSGLGDISKIALYKLGIKMWFWNMLNEVSLWNPAGIDLPICEWVTNPSGEPTSTWVGTYKEVRFNGTALNRVENFIINDTKCPT